MGTCLMLRDGKNSTIGYVMLLKERLLCRAENRGGSAMLYVLCGGSLRRAAEIELDGREHPVNWSGKAPEDALLADDGGVIAAAGKKAADAYALIHAERRRSMPVRENAPPAVKENGGEGDKEEIRAEISFDEENNCKTAPPDAVLMETGKRHPLAMQPRWPPPPCMMRPVYDCGEWKEEN